jgi:sn-glycerol 3-phosphate transport system permease protein
MFLYYPALDTFSLSTQLVKLGIPRTAFVCVDNFTSLAGDPKYLQAIGVTVFMSVAIVFFSLAISLAIALVAYLPVKGARIYRTLLIWPYAISPVVAGIIFLLIFNPLAGIFNYFYQAVFGVAIPWLNDPAFAPWAVIIASVWKSLGFNILFYIAGLQNVPGDLVEAAAIDGANAWRRFWSIVFPMLSPITFFLIITNTTYAVFETFGTIDTLTSGGPLGSTTTLMFRIYEVGFTNRDLGKAAAQSIVLFIMVIGFTLLQFRTTARRVTYGA